MAQLLSRRPQLTLELSLLTWRPPWAVLRTASSGLEVRPTGGDAAPSRMSRRPPRCTHQVCTAQRGKGGVPTASHHHGYCRRTPQAAHGHYLVPGKTWLPLSTSQSTPTAEVTARAHIARARLGLVTKRCLEVPPECMQGASLWPGRALERQRSAAHDPCCAGGWGSRLSDQHST